MRKLWLAAICLPLVVHAQASPSASFEVASMKKAEGGGGPGDIPRNMDPTPGHFSMHNVPLRYALEWAFDLKDYQISGPAWITNDERFDIDARAAADTKIDQMRIMLQNLLKDRLQMKSHFEKKDMQVYLLSRTGGALKVKEGDPNGQPSLSGGADGATFHNQPISRFTFMLTRRLDRPVLDRTNLPGIYDFTVDLSGLGFNGGPPEKEDAPTIFTTVQRDLGLKLESKKEPVDVLILDHVEKVPISN
jgi:uncharacterized protein (TIGR03435 family)